MSQHDHPHHDHTHDHDHDHDHDHGHDHSHGVKDVSRLGGATLLTLTFAFIEAAGGVWSGSLALIADAGHMFTDAGSLLLAWLAFRLSRKPADAEHSFGHHRYPVLAAFVNGLSLLAISIWIVAESISRLLSPVAVDAQLMLIVACIGLAANVVSFLILHGGSSDNLNMRGALAHVISDLLGSAAAIVAAIVILYTGWTMADPLLSAFVALLILRTGWRIVRDSAQVLTEGTPASIDVPALSADLVAHIPGLLEVHHVHVWMLTPERLVLTLHAQPKEGQDGPAMLAAIRDRLREHHRIEHATIQIEPSGCTDTCDIHAGDERHSH